MARKNESLFTDQDRDDLQALNCAIALDLQVEERCTTATIALGVHLGEVKRRRLWRIDQPCRRSSFYQWVRKQHHIQETMSKTYMLIGREISAEAVAGRRISVNALHEIALAEPAVRPFLIQVADHHTARGQVQVARDAAQAQLLRGATLAQAEEAGRAALQKTRQPRPGEQVLEGQLAQALRTCGRLAAQKSYEDGPLSRAEQAAWELLERLTAIRKARETDTAVTPFAPPRSAPDGPCEPVTAVTGSPETTPGPLHGERSETSPPVAVAAQLAPPPTLLPTPLMPLLVVVAGIAAKGQRDEEDVEYLLRLPRPPTRVPLAAPPDPPPVARGVVEEIEPLLGRLAGLCQGGRGLSEVQLKEALELAPRALALAEAAVGATHPLLVRPLEWLASLRTWIGDLTGGEEAMRRILLIWERHDDDQRGQVLEWQSCLGGLLTRMGRHGEGERLLRQVWSERKRRLPAGHPLLQLAEENLGIEHAQRRPPRAGVGQGAAIL